MGAPVPPWDLLARLGDDDVVVVDCRGAEERRLWPVQIPGSLQMTVAEILEAPWALPDDELIVLYDADGGGGALRKALHVLTGSARTAVPLDGGLRAWLTAGFPTERCAARAPRAAATAGCEPAPSHG